MPGATRNIPSHTFGLTSRSETGVHALKSPDSSTVRASGTRIVTTYAAVPTLCNANAATDGRIGACICSTTGDALFSTCSQGLWQHGASCLALGAALWALDRSSWTLLGFLAGPSLSGWLTNAPWLEPYVSANGGPYVPALTAVVLSGLAAIAVLNVNL